MQITVTNDSTEVTIKLPLDSSAEELFNAFSAAMVGMTWEQETFEKLVYDFLCQKFGNKE